MGVGLEYYYLYFGYLICLRNRQPNSKLATYWSEYCKYKKFYHLVNLPGKNYTEQPFLYRSATSRILSWISKVTNLNSGHALVFFDFPGRWEKKTLSYQLNKKIQKENLNSETCPPVHYHSVRCLQWTSFYSRFVLKSVLRPGKRIDFKSVLRSETKLLRVSITSFQT